MDRKIRIGIALAGGSKRAPESAPFFFADWEKEKYQRLRPIAARHRFLVGHLLVRQQLSLLCHGAVSPAQWRLWCNSYGKPGLDPAYHADNLFFSLSYSSPLVISVVSTGGPVGIDVERFDKDDSLDIQAALSPEEQRYLGRLDSAARYPATLAIWTGKEAVAKMTGLGFSLDFPTFSCLPSTEPVVHSSSRSPARFQPEHIEIKRFFLSLHGSRYCCSLASAPADLFFAAQKKIKKDGINVSPIRLPVREKSCKSTGKWISRRCESCLYHCNNPEGHLWQPGMGSGNSTARYGTRDNE